MRTSFWAILSLLLFTSQLGAGVITPQCLAYRSSPTPTPNPDLVNCPQYRDLACCDTATDSLILPNANGTQLYGFDWDRCGTLSPACQKFFQAESCYFECDPYQAPFASVTEKDPVAFTAIPLCASYCNAWFEACKSDLTCGDEWMTDFVPVKDSNGETYTYQCAAGSHCRTFAEIFHSGRDLCDNLWGASFRYSENTTNCAVWDWAQTTSNPNKHLERVVDEEPCCDPNYVQTKPKPKPEPGCMGNRELTTPAKQEEDLGVCSQFKDLSCCGPQVSNLITQDINDPRLHWYDWNQCGHLSPKCESFFKAESCYYECDPYVHQWKNPTQVTPDSTIGIPLCASLCDSWFDACKEDFTCGDEWLTDFVPAVTPNGTHGFVCPEGSKCSTFAQVFQNSREMCDLLWGAHYFYSENKDNCVQWDFPKKNPNAEVVKTYYGGEPCPQTINFEFLRANAAAIVLGVLFVLTFVVFGTLLIYLVVREKKQNPVFGIAMNKVG